MCGLETVSNSSSKKVFLAYFVQYKTYLNLYSELHEEKDSISLHVNIMICIQKSLLLCNLASSSNYVITNFTQPNTNKWLLCRVILGTIGKTILISNNISHGWSNVLYLKKIVFKYLETFVISFNHYKNPVKNALLFSISKGVNAEVG